MHACIVDCYCNGIKHSYGWMDSDNGLPHLVCSVNVRGFFTHHRRKRTGAGKLVASWHWPMAAARPHSHSLIWSFSSNPPFPGHFAVRFQRRRFCASPFASAITIIFLSASPSFAQKFALGKASRTTLLQYSDCLDFGKRTDPEGIGKSHHPHFPFPYSTQ
jgi:hypothetical protein